MFGKCLGSRRPFSAFRRDEAGAISTEYVLAVAVVVLLAVPVVAVVNDGTTSLSSDVLVQVEDTDSFGGQGFHPGDDRRVAATDEDLYVPGALRGVGMPLEGEEGLLAAASDGDNRRPRYFANVGTSTGTGGGQAFQTAGDPAGGGQGGTPGAGGYVTPAVPASGFAHAGGDTCEIVTAKAEQNTETTTDAIYIVASGR